MTIPEYTLRWLLQGDPSIRWQTLRDLAGADRLSVEAERNKVATEGWGSRLLSHQDSNGLWAGKLYSPKWKSTTYTMLLIKDLGLPQDNEKAQTSCKLLLDRGFYGDGGINYFSSMKCSELCVTGMILSILAYFRYPDDRIHSLASHLLERQMPDGGWNCLEYRGATHSSFHTTINVLEGLHEYGKCETGLSHRVAKSRSCAMEFLRAHRHFRSHRTGAVADEKMTRLSFPPRWHYDILRGLDYFQACGVKPDPRDFDAIELIRKKQAKDGTWSLQNRHPGQTFFEMEQTGKPSRWNTLRALRVLKWFGE